MRKTGFSLIVTVLLVFFLGFTGCSDSSSDSDNKSIDPEKLPFQPSRTINIGMLNATYPVLNFALSMYDINKDPTYVAIQIKNILNYDELPLNVEPIPGTSTSDNNLFGSADLDAYRKFIKEKYEEDNKTMFNLHISDSMMRLLFDGMVSQAIPETNYKVHLYLERANYTAMERYNAESLHGNPQPQYDFDCTWVDYTIDLVEYMGSSDCGNDEIGYVSCYDPADDDVIGRGLTLAILNHFDNIVLYVHNAEAFKAGMPFEMQDEVSAFIEQGKIVQSSIGEKVEALKSGGHMTDLEYVLKLRDNTGYSVAAQFDKPNNKKTLLILGTRTDNETVLTYPDAGPAGAILFSPTTGAPALIDRVRTLYNADYNLFYKGHPATQTDEEKAKLLNLLGVEEVPSAIPAETMMYFYDGVYIGGYPGTTFFSAMPDQTVFSFGQVTALAPLVADGLNPEYFMNTAIIYYDNDNETWYDKKLIDYYPE